MRGAGVKTRFCVPWVVADERLTSRQNIAISSIEASCSAIQGYGYQAVPTAVNGSNDVNRRPYMEND